MQARFYLPMYGRFGSPDPARDQHFEETQSWNIYSYVRNNPVMLTDPTGMEVPEFLQRCFNLITLHGFRTDAERPRMPDGSMVGGRSASESAAQAARDIPLMVKEMDPIPNPQERREPATEAARSLNSKDDDRRAQEFSEATRGQAKDAQDTGVKGADFVLGKYPGRTAVDVVDAAGKAIHGDKRASKS